MHTTEMNSESVDGEQCQQRPSIRALYATECEQSIGIVSVHTQDPNMSKHIAVEDVDAFLANIKAAGTYPFHWAQLLTCVS
jgi:hypothetical protein